MFNPLRLKAEDEEDLLVMAAYLQDAVTVMEDITYLPAERRFVLMLNRYTWEQTCSETGKPLDVESNACCRIRTGLHFNDVLKVSRQNFPVTLKSHVLELLTVEARQAENGNWLIDLIFAGDEVVRLETEIINAQMQDIGHPWPAKCHPKHKILESLRD
ncbi:DUF2948 family protein [Emcibacter sp.]|uniref:DUF2948 family protein n=1 Tax=Emcibacter sp. TaxID=1979954 RepID=UPI002AA749E4|nr:DUF2948 family protein [Emcibacter sp.]